MNKTRLIALLLAAAHCCTPRTTPAQMLVAGVQEIAAAGELDLFSTDNTRAEADVSYGLYFLDYFQLGIQGTFKRSGNEKIYASGIKCELDYELGLTLFPYLGGHILLASYDTLGNKGRAGIIGLKAGTMLFLSEQIALYGELGGNWATASIYADRDNTRSTDANIRVGMRYFFY